MSENTRPKQLEELLKATPKQLESWSAHLPEPPDPKMYQSEVIITETWMRTEHKSEGTHTQETVRQEKKRARPSRLTMLFWLPSLVACLGLLIFRPWKNTSLLTDEILLGKGMTFPTSINIPQMLQLRTWLIQQKRFQTLGSQDQCTQKQSIYFRFQLSQKQYLALFSIGSRGIERLLPQTIPRMYPKGLSTLKVKGKEQEYTLEEHYGNVQFILITSKKQSIIQSLSSIKNKKQLKFFIQEEKNNISLSSVSLQVKK